MSLLNQDNIDQSGITISFLCVVYCLLLPVLSIVTPYLAQYFQSEAVHFFFLIVLVPVSIFVFNVQRKARHA